jgi:flagellar biosynthesis protein FlhB
MADDDDKESKTEQASEKKIRDAVEKGNLPFSKEAPIFATLLAVLVFALFFAYDAMVRLAVFLATFLERPNEWSLSNSADAISLYQIVFVEIARAIVVVMALLVAAGVGASVLQNLPQLVGDRIMPKMNRISPMAGWKRLFGVQGFVEFLKSLGKVLFAGVFLTFAMSDVHVRLLEGMLMLPSAFGMQIRDIVVDLVMIVAFSMALIAGVDLLWTRFHWMQELRMTKQEVKDEHKQAEGDPILKARMRSLARDRVRQRMMASVPRATMVIANPTHFSIALRYVREETAAPIVVAKGQDLIALKIREVAEEHGIPIFEDVTLARSMFKQVSVDSMIPPQFYQAVAELIRIIQGNRKAPKAGTSAS